MDSFFSRFDQKKISPFTSIYENKCYGDGFNLIKMIYKHCPILFYSTIRTSALRLWWKRGVVVAIVVVVTVVVVGVDVVGHQGKTGTGMWLIRMLISRQ